VDTLDEISSIANVVADTLEQAQAQLDQIYRLCQRPCYITSLRLGDALAVARPQPNAHLVALHALTELLMNDLARKENEHAPITEPQPHRAANA
jgi:hypothetical protein